jgi:hypothetical protein
MIKLISIDNVEISFVICYFNQSILTSNNSDYTHFSQDNDNNSPSPIDPLFGSGSTQITELATPPSSPLPPDPLSACWSNVELELLSGKGGGSWGEVEEISFLEGLS